MPAKKPVHADRPGEHKNLSSYQMDGVVRERGKRAKGEHGVK